MADIPKSSDPSDVSRLPIIGIGASAGGIPALKTLLSALPAKLGAAVVVIVHLDPDHGSEMDSILAAYTGMRVVQVVDRRTLDADTVYVIPPNRELTLSGDDLISSPFTDPHGKRTPIDTFFRSLAEETQDGFAVVLTGSGFDGAAGVRNVKEAGGLVLVQEPEEAEYPSMPRAAIASGADYVLPLRQLALRLAQLVQDKRRFNATALNSKGEEALRRILDYVRVKTGQDFSKYKRATVMRRLARRMQLAQTQRLNEYLSYLKENQNEVLALLSDLLISVTCFFRDPAVFEALAKKVVPILFDRKNRETPLRVWVPGCATGEEAYSLAILLLEEAARRDGTPGIQIFASDIDSRALAVAREGRYPASIVAEVSEDRLHRFFTREDESFRIRPEVRDLIVFASHNLIKDPPFSKCDLISCRNLLIYLDRDLQRQVLGIFSYSLSPGGFLLLGTSETADNPPGLFNVVDREARFYQLRERARLSASVFPSDLTSHRPADTVQPPAAVQTSVSTSARLHRDALEASCPPSALVDDKHLIINLSETAGRYLHHPSGPVTRDIIEIVRPELRLDLSAALHRAFEHNERTLTLPISVELDGSTNSVALQVRPTTHGEKPRVALVFFLEGGAVEEMQLETLGSVEHTATVKQLREELLATRALLRTTREQYEEATEQRTSANEELQSINEEYRSTAEELETSKEELQSINEELQSLNGELRLKLELEARAHNDLQNLMGATDIATLFLDMDLHIKRFTPRTTDLFSLHPGDEGRPISDFTHKLQYTELISDAKRVLADLAPVERLLNTVDGSRWFTTRLRPYRTLDDKIEGVVITFFDVTEKHETDAYWAERQKLLLGELSHRVKNTLAVVQVIVRQSLRSSGANSETVDTVLDRLRALSKSHDLLLRSEWTGANLEDLAKEQLSPYYNRGRLQISGGPFILAPEIATPLGLVLHELATNAAKYGALSGDEGQVKLVWRNIEIDDEPGLELVWQERGGPKVVAPQARGTGSVLIENSIDGARVTYDYDPLGLTTRLLIPLPSSGATASSSKDNPRN